MRILTLDEILKLHAAVVSAQLVASRSALLVGIDARFVAGLPDALSPSDQILEDLNALNEARVLADGSFPLELWLRTAVARAGGKEEAAVFQHALARCRDTTATEADPLCPFPGLEFFDEDRAADFFGREAEVSEALAQLGESRPPRRWLQIDGPSGAGKSSFARAGFVPAVRGGRLAGGPRSWVTAVLRPGHDPITSLAEALVKHAKPPLDLNGRDLDDVTTKLRNSTTALASLLREGRPDGHGVLLLVDQLEEAFTLARADDAAVRQFDALLAAALEDREGPLLLVTTIRSDFVARMGELPALEDKLSNFQAVRFYLRAMGEAGLRAAIEKPAERAGLRYDHGLVDRILADSVTSHGALPLVAHALQGLYALRDGRTMTLRVYEELGGVGGALAKSADGIVDGLDDDGRERARKILLRLVKIGRGTEDIRQTAQREDVLGAAGGGPEAEQVLARLSGGREFGVAGESQTPARLVVVSGDKGSERVDLVHEALIQRWEALRGWLKDERQALELRDDVEEAARIWEASGEDEGALPKGATLARFRVVERSGLKVTARGYLDAAEDAERRVEQERRVEEAEKHRSAVEQARLQRRVIVGLMGFVIALALAVAGLLWQWNKAEEAAQRAERQAKIADARRIAALAAGAGARNAPQQQLLLSVEAWKSANVTDVPFFTDVEQALRNAVWSVPGMPLAGHDGDVRWVAFSQDSKRIITASQDGTARVWNADGAGDPVVLRGHNAALRSASFNPDGKRVVSGSDDKTARVWSADGTGEPVVLRGHLGGVTSAVFSPDGKRIVTASWDGTARVWSADGTGEPIVLRGHEDFIGHASFSPDSKRIVTASNDKTARVWNANGTGEPIVLRGHEDWVVSASFSPDSERVTTASSDKTARVWNADGTGEPIVLRGHKAGLSSAVFGPSGGRIVTTSWDMTAQVWSAEGLGEPVVLRGHEDSVTHATFSPDGERIVTASSDKTARVWNADGTSEPVVLRGHEGSVGRATFSPDGERIVTASSDKTARVWSADGTSEPVVLRGQGQGGGVWSAAFSPDGRRVVSASGDSVVRVWNTDGTGRPLKLSGHDAGAVDASFSPDGERIVTASFDKTARVWNANGTGEPVVLRGHEDRLWSASFSPDGKQIVTASVDKTARVWNADGTGKPAVLRGHVGGVNDAAFSLDGKRIVTASDDKTARVWSADGKDEPIALLSHEHRVRSAAFSPDGKQIVTASDDGTAWVWNADGTGEPIALRGHKGSVTGARFSPDGKRIITASVDKTARVWSADGTGEPVVLRGHERDVTSASFSPDGKQIVTTSEDDTARVWVADNDLLVGAACARAGRNFTREEWHRFFGNEPYRKTCGQWPVMLNLVPTRVGWGLALPEQRQDDEGARSRTDQVP